MAVEPTADEFQALGALKAVERANEYLVQFKEHVVFSHGRVGQNGDLVAARAKLAEAQKVVDGARSYGDKQNAYHEVTHAAHAVHALEEAGSEATRGAAEADASLAAEVKKMNDRLREAGINRTVD